MRIVTLLHGDRRRLGRLADDGRSIDLFDIDGSNGALALIEQPSTPAVAGRVALADEALYAAKHQGRDRYVAIDQGAGKVDPGATAVLPPRDAPLREVSAG